MRRWQGKWKWLAALMLLGLLLTVSASADGVTRALLIGCDDFVSMNQTAQVARNNVTGMVRVMMGGALNTETLVTRSTGMGSVDELEELIKETFAGADETDVSYFYLSTHGVWNGGQDGGAMTFMLSDGHAEDAVTARELRTMLDRVPGTKVLLLDACHSGAVIGKGVTGMVSNVFAGPDYKVICSSGGAEESWMWSGELSEEEEVEGAGYFSGALTAGLSSVGSFAADANADGRITLTELKRYLRAACGESTVQTYPEEDDFAVMTYDA